MPEPEPLDEAPEALALPEGLRLDANLALLAGAGTGKTYSLVTMCLHLLSGAREAATPLACGELGLLTFTDKAAGEMRDRLRERLDALAHGDPPEAELRGSFEALGRPFPPRAFWRGVRDDLGGVFIGTFHALCTQLLRRAPPGSGVNPNFELLDEREGRRLLREVVERVVLRRLQERHHEVRALVTELGFGDGSSPSQSPLVDALVPVAARIREEGLLPEYVQVADGYRLRRQFDEQLADLRALTRSAHGSTPRHLDRLHAFAELLARLDFDSAPELLPRMWDTISRVNVEPFASLKAYVRAPDERGSLEKCLRALHGACVMAPHEAAIRELLREVADEHRALLERRAALDFTGLLVAARDLLRDCLEARAAAQGRFRALLVDEFQDTNRLQLELVLLLGERREGAPRPITQAFEAQHDELLRLPLEPAALAVVGDRKQAIYEFRGADVGVFETMARCLERSGGGRAYLKASRRSSPALVEALNRAMTRLLDPARYGPTPRDFEVGYLPRHDDLVAVRTRQGAEPPFVRLTLPLDVASQLDAAALKLADAEGIARWVRQTLEGGRTVVAREAEAARPLRGGDVALLFQRFTQLELYRQALVQQGVRHRVVRGRGFYGAQEVLDLANVLWLLGAPDDVAAFAAVLRSPLVCLTDTSLVELALGEDRQVRGLVPREVLEGGRRPTTAGPVELQRLERLVASWRRLAPERDRLGLRALVRAVLADTEFQVAVAAGPFGEQALANLDKLLELASAREREGVSVAGFAAELRELAELEPTEAQADVVDELDADAVTLCTVHQAKGLEWPVVVLPDVTGPVRAETGSVKFDREGGLSVRPLSTDEGELQSFSERRVRGLLRQRAVAERLRLLYVAMTRARDQVVFGLWGKPKKEDGNWAYELSKYADWHDVRAVTLELDVRELPARPPTPTTPAAAPTPEAQREAEQLVARVRARPAAQPERLLLPVTQLQEYVSCPRRYHLLWQVGLSERPPSFERPADDAPAPVADVRVRGTAAHKLLELTPLELVGTPELLPALQAIRRAEGLEPAAGDDVMDWVTGFWRTRFGASLKALGDDRVHRELPFVLTLRDEAAGDGFELLLRGQIDLLVEDAAGALLVVDYKTSTRPPAGLEPYRFQLGCYALAAARFAGREFRGPIRAGIAFLRDEDKAPALFDELPDVHALERALVTQARALAEAQVTHHWPGRALPTCQSLHCGFAYRCH